MSFNLFSPEAGDPLHEHGTPRLRGHHANDRESQREVHHRPRSIQHCLQMRIKELQPVAIKRLYSHSNPQSVKQFETELELLSSIKDRNLVSLQAYSLSPLGSLLFYDYMDNGSLWDFLHGPAKKKKKTLL
ncbi:hypothetical protein HID58_082846, partial [Brassica napus]